MKTYEAADGVVYELVKPGPLGRAYIARCPTVQAAQRLAALLNEGEADKARLDWLDERATCAGFELRNMLDVVRVSIAMPPFGYHKDFDGPTARASIDAALTLSRQ